MKYWLSAQAPPLEGDPDPRSDRLPLAEGREAAGRELEEGDLVLVYQSRSGRAVRRREADGTESRIRTVRGRQGIVAVAEVVGRIAHDGKVGRTEYADGTALSWSWYAPLRVFAVDGHVPLPDVNRILGFKASYNFGGFAYRNSGLREIGAHQYWALVELFRSNGRSVGTTPPFPAATPRLSQLGSEEERHPHRLLVDYVAADPTFALREEGLETVGVGREFPFGETVDLVLEDRAGTIVAVQAGSDEDPLRSIARACVRRAMLELAMERRPGESRAFVVAYSVSEKMRELCASYGVECFAIDRNLVRSWDGHRRSRALSC